VGLDPVWRAYLRCLATWPRLRCGDGVWLDPVDQIEKCAMSRAADSRSVHPFSVRRTWMGGRKPPRPLSPVLNIAFGHWLVRSSGPATIRR